MNRAKLEEGSQERENIIIKLANQKYNEGHKDFRPFTLELIDRHMVEYSVTGYDMFKLNIRPPSPGERREQRFLEITENGFAEFIDSEEYEGLIKSFPLTERNIDLLAKSIDDQMWIIKEGDVFEMIRKRRQELDDEIKAFREEVRVNTEKKNRAYLRNEVSHLTDVKEGYQPEPVRGPDDPTGLSDQLRQAMSVIKTQQQALDEAQKAIKNLQNNQPHTATTQSTPSFDNVDQVVLAKAKQVVNEKHADEIDNWDTPRPDMKKEYKEWVAEEVKNLMTAQVA